MRYESRLIRIDSINDTHRPCLLWLGHVQRFPAPFAFFMFPVKLPTDNEGAAKGTEQMAYLVYVVWQGYIDDHDVTNFLRLYFLAVQGSSALPCHLLCVGRKFSLQGIPVALSASIHQLYIIPAYMPHKPTQNSAPLSSHLKDPLPDPNPLLLL